MILKYIEVPWIKSSPRKIRAANNKARVRNPSVFTPLIMKKDFMESRAALNWKFLRWHFIDTARIREAARIRRETLCLNG